MKLVMTFYLDRELTVPICYPSPEYLLKVFKEKAEKAYEKFYSRKRAPFADGEFSFCHKTFHVYDVYENDKYHPPTIRTLDQWFLEESNFTLGG